MKKTEIKSIIKSIATKHGITIINQSLYISDDKLSAFTNGYINGNGGCVEMYFNFDLKQYTIQHLSSVSIHDVTWYKM